uniref:IU_nuc_hydro domain-containing protein n=2 Tax=Heligmosomoides polygyrus TaxID=6339 RepID=A0A183FP67_HELPZ
LIRKPLVVQSFFGNDGIGDRPDLPPEATSADYTAQEEESAVLALIRLVKENEDVTLVTIGPLTNVAMAYKLDPNFEKNLKKLVVLGGNYFGKKHENCDFTSSEFNFGTDPEAAKIVVEEMNTLITMVPREVHYMRGVEVIYSRDAMAKYNRQYNYCDEIAVAVAINEDLIAKKTIDLRIGIELAGQMTR